MVPVFHSRWVGGLAVYWWPKAASTAIIHVTLRLASFVGCHFPRIGATHALHFPRLKQLVLYDVGFSNMDLERLLAGYIVLEGLQLQGVHGLGSLRISSVSLWTIGVSCRWTSRPLEVLHDLVIEDVPCLNRLIVLDPVCPTTVTVIEAPQLTVVGFMSTDSSRFVIGPVIIVVLIYI